MKLMCFELKYIKIFYEGWMLVNIRHLEFICENIVFSSRIQSRRAEKSTLTLPAIQGKIA